MTEKKPDSPEKTKSPELDKSVDSCSRIQSEIDILRARWRKVRLERLRRRDELMASGVECRKVRKDIEYRRLRKEQQGLSRRLAHLERKLNRSRARLMKVEKGG